MKDTPESHNAPSSFAQSSPSRAIHLWIFVALVANALLLCVIALQIKQVGHQLAGLANQDRPPALGQYAYAGNPASEKPYSVMFAKNERYSAYRASNSDPIPVKIVNTPISVEVENKLFDPILVKIDE
jgi:hypothetical protein